MIYIVNLNHDTVENLFNDDLYWRAEPGEVLSRFPDAGADPDSGAEAARLSS